MATINLTSELVAGGVGVGDELLEFLDRNQLSDADKAAGKTMPDPFRGFTDWGRIIAAGAGAFMFVQNTGRDIAEPLLYVGTALSVKSVSRFVRESFFDDNNSAGARRNAVMARRNGVPVPMPALRGRSHPSAIERVTSESEDAILVTVV